MEKNQHTDPLDNYVRRVFNTFEPEPSDQIWRRIEQELEKEEDEKKPFFWKNAAAAAILLLSAGWLYSHFYYTSQIRALESVLQDTPASPAMTGSPLELASLSGAATDTSSLIIERTKQKMDSEHLPTAFTANQKRWENAPTAVLPIFTPSMEEGKSPLTEYPTNQPLPTQLDPIVTLPLPSPSLATRTPLPLSPVVTNVDPSASTAWYVRFGFTQPKAKERINRLQPPPGGRPPRWQNSEPRVQLQDYTCMVGTVFNQTWGLETGLSYRKLEKTSVHRPEFMFRDGRPHPGQLPGPPQFDFSYNLETYGGEAEVTIRVEQQDNNQVNPEEPLPLKVSSLESMDLLRWPLLATARARNKQLQLTAKAGLVGNFILRQNLSIQQSTSQNGRFSPSAPDRAFTINGTSNKSFFMGYQVSMGVEYQPFRKVGFSLEPTIAGDFRRGSANQARLPQLTTTGIQVGLVYWM